MSPKDFPHRRFLSLLLVTLFAGPIGCDPAVNRFDLDAAQSKVDTQVTRLAMLDQQLDAARKEFKDLQAYGGTEHQAKLRTAVALRAEKTQLEALKKDLDGRLQNFEKEAARHRDALSKMKQQQKQP